MFYITVFTLFLISGCGDTGDSLEQKESEEVIIYDTNRVTIYDSVKIPVRNPENKSNYTKRMRVQQDTDYVPPKDGGVNKYWYGNRNRKLSNDSNCYFGKGKENRKRYRWGQQKN